MRSAYRNLILILLSLFMISNSYSQEKSVSEGKELPGGYLNIKLVTIGPGDDLTSWWGHTAIIVEDQRFKTSLFYNYGLFSFEQENFVSNFAMGRLIFWVGVWNTSDALAHYLSLNREIRMQILNLSPEKKVEMTALLARNVLPQNREYLYDHYYDNCSTRVRDLLNKMIDGQFYTKSQAPGKMTFRQHTRRHTDAHFCIDWLLMFLMNNSIDKEIRQWDDMFLPEELEYYVANLTYQDSNGQIQHLVKSSYTYYNAKDRKPLPINAPAHWPRGLAIGVFSGLLFVVLGWGYLRKIKFNRQMFGVYQALVGIVYGIPGLVLFLMSFFTDHTVTYHNQNLFLANPLTIVFIPLGIGLSLNKKFTIVWLPRLWYLITALNLFLLIMKIFPFFEQYNWLSISLIIPLSVSASITWYGIEKSN